MPPPKVAVGNNKGGSGKTTIVMCLACALAELGHRVLVIDMDPQANVSRRLGLDSQYRNTVATASEAIKDARPGIAASAIHPANLPSPYAERISVLPARFDLEERVSEAGVVGAVRRLSRSLEGATDEFDYGLIDCPPSLGHLTQQALAASDFGLGALKARYDSVEGGIRWRDFINNKENLRNLGNSSFVNLGMQLVHYQEQRSGQRFQEEGLADLFDMWEPNVPDRACYDDIEDAAMPLRLVGTPYTREQADLWQRKARELLERIA